MTGYILAAVTSVLYSIYILPKKLVKEKTIYYTVFLTFGFFLASAIFYLFFNISGICKEKVSSPIILFLLFRGFCWFLSAHLASVSIDKLGVSRSMQYRNLKGPFGVILALLILQEFLITNVSVIFAATLLTFISAIILTIKTQTEKCIDKYGVIYAIMAALLLALTNLMQKWVTDQGIVFTQHIYTSIGSFAFALLYVAAKERNLKSLMSTSKRSVILAMLGGGGYFLASFFQALAFERLPGSVVAIIVQISAVWSILIGIIIFKEIDLKKHWKRITAGIVLTIVSILMLL